MILPTAEIVCLGNELLIGITINTNASFIGEQLTKLGFEVRRVTCIRDDLDLAVEFFKELYQRKPELIIVSGGLGPTYDDIQLEVISKSTGLELQEHSDALQQVEEYYGKKNLHLTKERRKMASIPVGCNVLSNHVGGAPGCHLSFNKMDIFCLPGVPSEMEDIFQRHIYPYLQGKNKHKLFEKKFQILNCVESEIAPYINKAKMDFPELYIKSHPSYKRKIGIILHISGHGESAEKEVSEVANLLQNHFKRDFDKIKIITVEE